MVNQTQEDSGLDVNTMPADPIISHKTPFSKVWILPIVAAFIGLGMVYNNWQNSGVKIEVTFSIAEGLEVGKTKVKYLDVAIGSVSSIRFNEQRDKIIVGIRIDKDMQDFLNSDSQFWVVKPRAGIEGISGISTLLSGVYIQISRGKAETTASSFVGLESPPITTLEDDGLHLTLNSQGGKKLDIGNPVIYRGFEVGMIESFKFDAQKRQAEYGVFIRAPYDDLINSNTLFWNASGLSITTDAQGLKVNLASLTSLITGGIQFGVPDNSPLGEQVEQYSVFSLYDDEQSAKDRQNYEYVEYVVLIEGSAKGLIDGASVEYRGIRIGTVTSPQVTLQSFVSDVTSDQEKRRIPITLRIEPERITQETNISLQEFDTLFLGWINNGLSATLRTANYLTGALYVDLDFDINTKAELISHNGLRVIPSRQDELASLTAKIDNILTTVENLPLRETLASTDKAIKSANATIQSLELTLLEMRKTMAGLQPDSGIYQEFEQTMQKLQTTLDGLQPVIKQISDKPNSLIFGSPKKVDKEPQAKKPQIGEPQ